LSLNTNSGDEPIKMVKESCLEEDLPSPLTSSFSESEKVPRKNQNPQLSKKKKSKVIF